GRRTGRGEGPEGLAGEGLRGAGRAALRGGCAGAEDVEGRARRGVSGGGPAAAGTRLGRRPRTHRGGGGPPLSLLRPRAAEGGRTRGPGARRGLQRVGRPHETA